MKISTKDKTSKGFTLIELSIVMILVILIAGSLVTMMRQQVLFFKWWNTQNFIAEEAPLINSAVVRIFSNANNFTIFSDLNAITTQQAGVTADGDAILLIFSQPDGSSARGAIVFDSTEGELVYNNLNATGTSVTSSWVIARGIEDASFDVVADTMQLTLKGPYGGELTYAATPTL